MRGRLLMHSGGLMTGGGISAAVGGFTASARSLLGQVTPMAEDPVAVGGIMLGLAGIATALAPAILKYFEGRNKDRDNERLRKLAAVLAEYAIRAHARYPEDPEMELPADFARLSFDLDSAEFPPVPPGKPHTPRPAPPRNRPESPDRGIPGDPPA